MRSSYLSWLSIMVVGVAASCLEAEHVNNAAEQTGTESEASQLSEDQLLIKSPFTKDVGDIIPVEKARAWVKNYQEQSKSIHSQFIGKQMFLQILEQPGCTGISFQYGINDNGVLVIVQVGVTSTGKLLGDLYVTSGVSCPEICPDGTHKDFNESVGRSISAADVAALAETYESQHPEKIRSHFFGSDLILELLNQERCVGLSMQYALDDFGKQQLILTGVDDAGALMQQGAYQILNVLSGESGDASRPCPPYCHD